MAEYYVLPKGFNGNYRLFVKKIWGKVTGGKVTVSIYRNFRTDKETSEKRQIEIGEKGSMISFALNKGRRAGTIDPTKIAMIPKHFIETNQAVLSQSLADYSSASSATDLLKARGGERVFRDPRLVRNLAGRRPIGYQPQITNIFEGASMTARASTADRLYVLISPAPQISQIAEVNTFTFFDPQAAGGIGGGGIGGGIGGAGGGLGGFGGGIGGAGGIGGIGGGIGGAGGGIGGGLF